MHYPSTPFHVLQGKDIIPNTPPPLHSSFTLVSAALFLTFYSPSTAAQCFLPFLKHAFPDAPPLLLPSSAVPYGGSIVASWDRLGIWPEAASASSPWHRGCLCSALLPTPGHLHPAHIPA